MKTGLVTVVVPVYKTEKYLDRCVESIIRQTYKNLEIILVDDGSPDICPQMCETWAEKDSRIKVVHKTNAGLGMARNTGMDHAAGEYICFFDSDDYVALDTIENAIALAKRDHSDLVVFGMTSVGTKGEIQAEYCPYTAKDCYKEKDILEFLLPNAIEGSSKRGKNFNLNMSSCTCLFSMELIEAHHWRFASEREYISEDYFSMLQLYAHVQTVSILKQACYYYCQNNTSLTHVYRHDRYERICHCYNAMMNICRELKYPEKIAKSLSIQFFGNVIGGMKTVIAAELSVCDKMRELKKIVKSQTLHHAFALMDIAQETTGRKLLIFAVKANCAALVYLLVKTKMKADNVA